MIKQKLQEIFTRAVKEAQKKELLPNFVIPEIDVTHPEVAEFGDYTTNVAMRLVGQAKMPPMKIAEILVNRILGFPEMKDTLCRVEIKKPGFINVTLERKFLLEELAKILSEKEKYGNLEAPRRNKAQVEFISANPTGKLHLGNGRGAFFGDVLANILAKAGYKVSREYYINDSKESKQIKTLGELLQGKKNPYKTEFVGEMVEKLQVTSCKLKTEGELGYLLASKIQNYNRQFVEKDLKIHFDVWFSEEDFYRLGKIKEALNWLETFGLTYQKDGALWFKSTRFGDDKDRVLVRQNGESTYFLSDIVYHKDKFERGFDKLIDVWGADHHGYVGRMQAAVEAMGRKGDLNILISQMVRLVKDGKEFKMSKRAGTAIDLEWLIKEVGLDVTRFFFSMRSLDTHMDFDLDKAKEQSSKNPVFYVQYAYARIASIIGKLQVASYKLQVTDQDLKSKNCLNLLEHSAELTLIRELIKFPELIEEISKNYAVHLLPAYAISLADKFHIFYENCQVLGDDENVSGARFSLLSATQIILKEVFRLLGISAPEKM